MISHEVIESVFLFPI